MALPEGYADWGPKRTVEEADATSLRHDSPKAERIGPLAPIHPSPVATPTVLNAAHYKLFQPDLEDPAYDDFAVAARSLNAFPIAALESVDISNAVLLPRLRDGRYATGITHIVGAGGGR